LLVPIVVRLQFELAEDDPRREELLMNTRQTFEEFQAELLAKGEAQALRGALLLFLEARFVSLPDELKARIEGTQDPEALRRWVPLAATAGLEDLGRRIEQDLAAAG
jgi:hypothetical protein